MKRFLKAVKSGSFSWWPLLVLVGLELALFVTNYKPGTWLIGWDSTMPELNFNIHLFRNLSAVWQEYRGVGLLDGMAHGANLVHVLYAWVLSLLVPANMIRYILITFGHLMGGIGMYVLLTRTGIGGKKHLGNLLALVGAFFYLYNPMTIQMFFAPLELFVFHFASLPWLWWILGRYLENGGKKYLLLLFLFNLAALPQAHVPTIAIVYGMVLIAGLVGFLISNPLGWKRIFIVLIVLFGIHAYWGLPYIYSALANAGEITQSKMNRLSNMEILLRNDAFGDLKSLVMFRGFSLNYEDWHGGGQFDFQMKVWRDYWFTPSMEFVFVSLFIITFIGGVFVLIRGNWQLRVMVLLMVFSLANLGSNIPILSDIGGFLRENIPFYIEIFRFTFTKFSILYVFSVSVLLAYGFWAVSYVGYKFKFDLFLGVIGLGLIVWSAWPVFQGNFYYEQLRLTVPSGYFEVFDFMSRQSNSGRVALLPQPTLYGWEHMKWGYRGSGFVWQGLPQPLMHRAFDPWSKYNEGYYHELITAVTNNSSKGLEEVLNKYHIKWVMVDPWIFQPGDWESNYDSEVIVDLLVQIPSLKKVYQTSDGITVYLLPSREDQYIFAPEEFTYVDANTDLVRKDVVFSDWGTYVSGASEAKINYPFAQVYNEELHSVTYETGYLSQRQLRLTSKLDNILTHLTIRSLPMPHKTALGVTMDLDYQGDQLQVLFRSPVSISDTNDSLIQLYDLPEFIINTSGVREAFFLGVGGEVTQVDQGKEVRVKQAELMVGEPIDYHLFKPVRQLQKLDTNTSSNTFTKCWQREGHEFVLDVENIDDYTTISTQNASGCKSVYLGTFSQPTLARVTLPYRSRYESRPNFCIVEQGANPYVCLNDEVFFSVAPSTDWSEVVREVVLEPGKAYWIDIVARPSDDSKIRWEIDYKNPIVETSPSIASYRFDQDTIWKYFERPTELVWDNGSEISLNLQTFEGKLSPDYFNRELDNCDLVGRGGVSRDISQEKITYTANGLGVACDLVVQDKLKSSNGHIVRFQGENLKGRSLKFFVNNLARRRNDIEELLDPGLFDNSYVLMPWQYNEDKGYQLTFETRSFGNETALNRLDAVEFYSFPVDWVSRLVVESQNFKGKVSNDIHLEPNTVKKIGTAYYQVKFTGQDGVVVLAQGYQSGWQAFLIKNNNLLQTYLPWLGGESLSHVKINNWSNGWELNIDKDSVSQGFGQIVGDIYTLVVIFWPQYLQWLGFGILGVTIVCLLTYAIVSNKHRRVHKV